MEKEFVDWLKTNSSQAVRGVRPILGIGDDAAIIDQQGPLVISTDAIADGTHFVFGTHKLKEIGHKAIAVNLSDLAAMGAMPLFATVNFFVPINMQLSDLKALYRSITTTAHEYSVQVVGGDTNRWSGKLVISITVIGGRYANAKTDFWRLSNGQPGESILVSGRFGGSISGRHLNFRPRVELARRLMESYEISACTDVTDSLSSDLAALAKSSDCGFKIQERELPISEDAVRLSEKTQKQPSDHALGDGEDFELVFTAEPTQARLITEDPNLPIQITRIGELTSSPKFKIMRATSDDWETLNIEGYDH